MADQPTPAQKAVNTNLGLAIAVLGAAVTGLVSWAVGTEWSRLWTAAHGVFGVMILVLTPAKVRGSVTKGMRRNRWSRWVSAGFGGLVVATIAAGFSHSTGLWAGVGYWSALWTHFLFGFIVLPLLLWHMVARPTRVRSVDIDRRLLVRSGAAVGVAGMVVGGVEVVANALDTEGSRRRFTGSHEVGSNQPALMPTVSWINDRAPDRSAADWELEVDGSKLVLATLTAASRPLDAVLDCTGGWWSLQKWDVVPISEVINLETRSFEIISATGYRVLFPAKDAENVFLAVGYGGEPLRRGHGAPVRIVAPGRRGPWWVKWVAEVRPTNRPWWLQPPFPTS